MGEWVDLGLGDHVRASEVVGVVNSVDDDDKAKSVTTVYEQAKCLVVLRCGRLMPAYVSARTLLKRLRAAEEGDPHAG